MPLACHACTISIRLIDRLYFWFLALCCKNLILSKLQNFFQVKETSQTNLFVFMNLCVSKVFSRLWTFHLFPSFFSSKSESLKKNLTNNWDRKFSVTSFRYWEFVTYFNNNKKNCIYKSPTHLYGEAWTVIWTRGTVNN